MKATSQHALDHKALIEAIAETGSVVPCQRPDAWQGWLSESADERAEAALRCLDCPVLAACAEAGQYEPFGTWAGQDRTRPRFGHAPNIPEPPVRTRVGGGVVAGSPKDMTEEPQDAPRRVRTPRTHSKPTDTPKGSCMTDQPTINHGPGCRRPRLVVVSTWRSRRALFCPGCGREAQPIPTSTNEEVTHATHPRNLADTPPQGTHQAPEEDFEALT